MEYGYFKVQPLHENISALLKLFEVNPMVTERLSSQGSGNLDFDFFFVISLKKLWNKVDILVPVFVSEWVIKFNGLSRGQRR